MKKIYIILAHKSPKQLEKQITSLQDEKVFFYVHLDLKANLEEFKYLENISNVEFIDERIDCIWGDFSIIIATLNLIKIVINNHNDGFCILMSGSDYPIKSNKYINSYLNENYDKIFIDLQEADKIWPTFEDRITKYRINLSSNRGNAIFLKHGFRKETIKHVIKGRIFINDLTNILFKKRKLKIKMKFYGGSQWWAMNINDLRKVYDFILNHEHELFSFFKYSHVPDEFFFHSIIKYINNEDENNKIQNSLTYVNWSRKNCPLPVTFEISDIKELLNQPAYKLYARKFDISINKDIFDKIDENIS